MRRYEEKYLLGLRNSKDILKENGLEILLKKTPELNYPGHLDPGEKAIMLKNWVSGKNEDSEEVYKWMPEQYTISDEERDMITPCLFIGEQASYNDDPLASCYLEDLEEVKNPYVSPWMEKDFSNLPKTVVFTAEFDGLRLQGELYAKKILAVGIDVSVIRYCGATHAYLDCLGFVPQSEDNCIEIANILKSI